MKKTTSILLTLVLLFCTALSALAEGTSSDAASPAAGVSDTNGIVVIDTHGREVRLDAPANRIIAIAPGDCEILFAIGAGDKVIAVGDKCDRPESVRSLPTVASYTDINIEQLISLDPDLVVMYDMARADEIAATLEAVGIKTVITHADSVSDTYNMMRLLSRLTGKEAEAESLITYMQGIFDTVTSVSPYSGMTVYFEVEPLSEGLIAAGKNTYLDDIAKILGMKNIFSDVEGWKAVSQEQVIERDPDYILTVQYNGNGPKQVEEIMNRPGWDKIKAVKNGNVDYAESDITRPSPRLVEAAYNFLLLQYPDALPQGNSSDTSDTKAAADKSEK